jgi:putative Holliday junction resolvase
MEHEALPMPSMTRFPRRGALAGVDHGRKRIGLAVSNADQTIAMPVMTLESKSIAHDTIHLLRFRDDYAIVGWVVGLPLFKSGDESPQAAIVREFGTWLEQSSGRPVTYWDERLTSHAAEAKLAMLGESATWNKGRVDGLAAQIILQAYLDQRPE